MWKRLIGTRRDPALTVARVALGIAILPHGAQKLLGWFGGYGVAGTVEYFSQALGIPAPLTLLVIFVEFFGALALIGGLLGRVAALGTGAVMVGAALMVHLPNGFFMNWSGGQGGEGFEYHILALGLSLAVMIGGSGALSVDRLLGRRGPGKQAEPVPDEGRPAEAGRRGTGQRPRREPAGATA
ncbi:MAG: DoxX family protein [Gemmatimonadetes bacterium]|uniref:DoxX family protein n=1 Tax=Candidatus Kutchimonas denitrificans TaxID=3056748 RepID=A0AAE4Z9U1_9BACT|nr:DoxX family protein [Gemmatimonadota bacterium]NIR74156.1 DoxX family protein [Candidatus Kutchimonas denitrificans]NIS01338.1 DoxX family protein [Gemmatimonadota bacterium]NIT67069.1 DoxX family protein [Gemmatimonadota bacterium]NIU51729.1 DoxX family membrane protein [Gemmatimonadota bacterium]